MSSSERSSPRRRARQRGSPARGGGAAAGAGAGAGGAAGGRGRSSSPATSRGLPTSEPSVNPGTPATPGTPRSPSPAPLTPMYSSQPHGRGTPGSTRSLVRRGDIDPPSRRYVSMGTPDSRYSRGSRAGGRGMDTSDPLSSETNRPDGSTDELTDQAVIWGTTIQVQQAMDAFKNFIQTYTTAEELEGDCEPHYRRLLAEMVDSEVYALNVDCLALHNHSPECKRLYTQLIKYPQEIIPIMDLVLNQEFEHIRSAASTSPGVEAPRVQVRLHNLQQVRRMRDLNPDDIDSLVSIKGMVIRSTSVIPDLRVAYFQCTECGEPNEVVVDRGRVDEPSVCECGAKHSFQIVHNRCAFSDKQLIKLQETPETIPEGETPHTISLFAYDDLVDVAIPGDRVLVTGVFRAIPHRPNPRTSNLTSVFKTHLDVIHFQKIDKSRLSAEDETVEEGEFKAVYPTGDATEAVIAARRERILAMSHDTNLYQNLAASLAPSIWELEDIKKGLLLQLFGGANKNLGKQGKFRGEINVLLCGDPGTSKSQLLSYVNKIAPRGIYTSGKGSSAVGLTAYVTKDPETKEPVLESGALVLSDRGICCIDEFDKMSDTTRSILHEVMEQQTVSIAKAGIICTLNARTSLLASANPVESRYNPKLSVVENIQLPPTLLSRFDLIYLVLDNCQPATDRRLAQHLVALYYKQDESTVAKPPYTLAQLTHYISYAKAHVQPSLTDDAFEELVSGYVNMRKLGMQGGKKVITATPRQLESLIRLSEAHARMRLSETVERSDVKEAIRLVQAATHTAAMDPRTGTIDMDMIVTGLPAMARDSVAEIADAVEDLFRGKRKNSVLSLADIEKMLDERTSITLPSARELESAVRILQDRGLVSFNPGKRRVQLLRPVTSE